MNAKSIDVIRRTLLVANSTYYMKHDLVANDVWYGEWGRFDGRLFGRYRRYATDIPLMADLNPIFISPICKWWGDGWGNLTQSGRDTEIA